jgi:5-methylthioribose kinase
VTTTDPDSTPTHPFATGPENDGLDHGAVVGYLRAHGLLDEDTTVVRIEPLSGGVSADIVAVETNTDAWVVKHVLPQLRVARTWVATQRRAITEARAMEVAADLLPGYVPALVFVDPVGFVTVQQRAPRTLVDWRAALLSGATARDVETARALGDALAALHNGTAWRPDLTEAFGDLTPLIELRIDPFHRTVAAALPEIASLLGDLVGELLEHPRCLVHGDFSPKNVLADGTQLRILDWEVAHLGNPVFDVAFLLAHLVCKAVHRPGGAHRYTECSREFYNHYTRAVHPALRPDDRSVAAHLAALVLSRTDGKSPAAYLTPDETDAARRLALGWLRDSSIHPTDVWSQLT